MQETRRHILEILRKRGQATVDDIVADLQQRRGNITPVTVRHHLNILLQDGLVTAPELRRRTSPGRPQHVYALTEKARNFFPNNYQRLAEGLLVEIRRQLPPDGVNVILEGVADDLASEAVLVSGPLEERMDAIVQFMNDHGYEASWERSEQGFILHTSNCPYHAISEQDRLLCELDMRLVSKLLGIVPRRIAHAVDGDDTCSYLIPIPQPNPE
ncbi:MAG: ArsR family transcriptional regulator [Aggregatilineales bacterium]